MGDSVVVSGRGGAVSGDPSARLVVAARGRASPSTARIFSRGHRQVADAVSPSHGGGPSVWGEADDERHPPSLAQGGVGGDPWRAVEAPPSVRGDRSFGSGATL